MHPLRKILFVVFVLAYAILLPVIILHSLGYKLSTLRGERIKETGGIFVTSAPPGAALSIDDRAVDRKTPLSLLSIAPGRHLVSLSREGYHTWSRNVVVEPGQVTFVDGVLLMLLTREAAPLSSEAFTDLIPLADEPWLLAARGPRVMDLVAFDMSRGELVPLVGPRFALRKAVVTSIERREGSPLLFVRARSGGGLRTIAVTLRSPAPLVRDVTQLVPGTAGDLAWSAGNEQTVFFARGSEADRVRLSGAPGRTRLSRTVEGFGAAADALYLLDAKRGLLRLPAGAARMEPVPGFDEALAPFPRDSFVHITPFGPSFFVFRDGTGVFSAALGPRRYDDEGVRGFVADPTAGMILFWQKHRIGLLSFYEENPARGAPRSSVLPEWIDASAGDVRQAFFAYGDTHILYRDGDSVLIAGPRREDGRLVRHVVNVSHGTSVQYSNSNGRLYFLDSRTGRLSTLVIVPRQPPLEELLLGLRSR